MMTHRQDWSAKARLMLSLYENNRLEECAQVMRELVGCRLTHQGRGDIVSYFYPAFHLNNFAQLLIASGHDLLDLFQERVFREESSWLGLPSVTAYLVTQHPRWVTKFLEHDVDPYWLYGPDRDSENWRIGMEYLSGFEALIEEAAENWYNLDPDIFLGHLDRFLKMADEGGCLPARLDALNEALLELDMDLSSLPSLQGKTMA